MNEVPVTSKEHVQAIQLRRWLLDNEMSPESFLRECNRTLPRRRWRLLMCGTPLAVIGRAFGVDTSTVSRWFSGKRSPTGDHARWLYEELRWTWELLLEDSEWTIVRNAWQEVGRPGDFEKWRLAHRDGVLVGVDRS